MTQHLFDRLSDLGHRFKHALRQGELLDELGLTPLQARTLAWVARNPHGSQSCFIQRVHRDKGQIARLFRSLEEDGWIERTPDPADRRARLIALTPAGQAAAERLMDHRRSTARHALAALTPDEQAELLRLVEKLASGLDDPDRPTKR